MMPTCALPQSHLITVNIKTFSQYLSKNQPDQNQLVIGVQEKEMPQ